MKEPLSSYESLNPAWDARLVEHASLRTIFIALLIEYFVGGALAASILYSAVRFGRFNWAAAVTLLACGIPAVRYSVVIYRRLH